MMVLDSSPIYFCILTLRCRENLLEQPISTTPVKAITITSTVINNDLSLINLLGSMFKSLMDYVIACEHNVSPVYQDGKGDTLQ